MKKAFVFCILSLFLFSIGALSANDRKQSIQKAINWLITQQRTDGVYSPNLPQPATTASVELAFLDSPLKYFGPFVTNGYSSIDKTKQKKGAFFKKDKGSFSFNTALALSAYLAKEDDSDKEKIEGAKKYLINMQFTEDDGPITSDYNIYGGWGYNHHTLAPNPDIVTSFFAVNALKRAKVEDEKIYKRALAFVGKCQNSKDGGFMTAPYYSKSKSLLGKSITTSVGKSYGSATAAAVALLQLSGAPKGDEALKAGVNWLGQNFILKRNPGMGEDERFLFYYLLARSLELTGDKVIKGKEGISINWAKDLSDYLLSIQSIDGRWVNDDALRKMKKEMTDEADPILTTSYAVQALSICNKVLGK